MDAEDILDPQECRTLGKTPRRRPYSCDTCSKQFKTPSKLARHYLTHTGQKPFQCEHCRKTFRQLVHLERHMMTHMLPLQCNVCHRQFKNEETFTKHQQMHITPPSNDKTSVHCLGCQRTFASEDKRLLHQCDFMNVAANRTPEPQRCDLCMKMFPSRSKLERHVMIHTGQKPFSCDVCGKSFRQKTHLRIHLLTHAQEKRFQCRHCFKSFKLKGKLAEHELGHTTLSTVRRKKRKSATTPSEIKNESNEILSECFSPFQCSSCDHCCESREILDSHTCLVADALKTLTCPGITPNNKEAIQQNKIHRLFQDTDNEILASASEAVGKLLKAEDLEDPEHLDTREPDRQPMMGARKKFLQLPGQKQIGKAKMRYRRLPQVGGRFQKHRVGIHFQGMLGNYPPMHSTLQAYEQVEPGEESHSLLHFLQGAQGMFLPQNKVSRCDQCDKTFPSMSKLRRHYLIHTGQKPFTCTECGKDFRQSAHLKRHQVTHMQRPLLQGKLEEYYKAFNIPLEGYQMCHDSSSSREIIPNGNQVKVIVVPEIKVEHESSEPPAVSKKTVTRRKNRVPVPRDRSTKSHQERPLLRKRTPGLQKTYKCSVCAKNFLSPSKLERHYLMHAGQRPFECQDCGKTFRQDPHLKRHMQTHIRLKD